MLAIPNHWTRETFGNTGYTHPYNRIAWLLMDRETVIESMNDEQKEVIDTIVGELKDLEESAVVEINARKSKRRAKILKARPLKENDDELKTAFIAAMANRQMSVDDMTYDTFKTIYDDIYNIMQTTKE